MSLFRRALAGATSELRADNAGPRGQFGDSTPPSASMSGARIAGMPISQGTAEQITAVYSCCGLIADTISSIPTQLRDGPQVATSSPVPPSPLLERPYSEISRTDWWKQVIWSLALRGNFYGQIVERDGMLYPTQIKPIHNDHAQVRRLADGSIEYRFYGKIVPIDDVVHVRYQSTAGSLVGLNPIEVCALSFGLAIAQDRYAESYFLNSATPSGVIKVAGDLSPAETRALLRNWLSKHQGLNQANLPSILTGGAEFEPITITPEQSQMLGALQFSQSRIAGMIFRVPLHMVGILDRASSWGRGLEVQERSFLSNTLIGYLTPLIEILTRLHPPGQFLHFDMRERLRGTALERAQTTSLMRLAGCWTADDGRATFDQPPLPDGYGQYTTQPINSELLLQALQALEASEGEGEEPEFDESTPTPSGGAPAAGGATRAADPNERLIRALTRALRKQAPSVGASNGNGHGVAVEQLSATEIQDAVLDRLGRVAPSIHLEPHVEINDLRVDVPPAEVRVDVAPAEVNVPPAEVRVDVAPAQPTIHVDAPSVHVDVPPAEVRVDVPPAEVHVEAPPPAEIHVDAPPPADVHVDVAPAEVRVEPQIHVPKPPAPQVVVREEKRGSVRKKVRRDAEGRIIEVTEESE